MSFKAGKRGVGVVLLTASVEASQQLSKTYRPWCILKDDGTVVSAHCTCIAGLGECCSHVVVLLFNVEATIKYGMNDRSPTEAACMWSNVSKKSTAAPVSEIQFFKPKPGQQVPETVRRQQAPIRTWSSEQVRTFLEQVKTLTPSTLVLSCTTDSEGIDSSSETAGEEREATDQHCSSLSAMGGHLWKCRPKQSKKCSAKQKNAAQKLSGRPVGSHEQLDGFTNGKAELRPHLYIVC
ncbi:hypothetical protein MTO96_035181 [Rhipicephalus appendiculatus]